MRYSDFYVDNLLRKAKIIGLSAQFHSHRWLDFLKGGWLDAILVCLQKGSSRQDAHSYPGEGRVGECRM
jgi:hypothetical protein